jgi:membrane-associated phospholipid phosphatase
VNLTIRGQNGFWIILSACAASIARTFRENAPLYLCAMLFCSATLAITQFYGIAFEASAGLFFLGMVGDFFVVCLAGLALAEFVRLARCGFPDRPLALMAQRLAAFLTSEDRPGNIFHSLVTLTPLMVSFAALKDQIPAMHPFSWDKTFMEWDRAIGMGHAPWEILQPWLGHAWITAGLNFFYDAWFLLMFAVLLSQAFAAKSSPLRLQFLLAFSFAWFIAGNVLAVVLSSAGPCFYGFLFPDHNPYAQQMAYLHAVSKDWPVWSVNVQQTLWHDYIAGHGRLGGISAMPSMHVTIAALMAIWGWRFNRIVGFSLAAFAALIVIGSIHLGWHYAVDGIAGILLAAIFWMLAGWAVRASARNSLHRAGTAVAVALDISRA